MGGVKKEYIALFFILILAAVFRFALLPTTVWSADAARDLLVSRHILLYHEMPNIGHVASGTNPVFYYPPVYYYLLALIQIPSTDIWYVLGVFVLLNITSIAVFYAITKQLSSPFPALVATSLYAFSAYYLDRQTTLSSMHFTLPLFLTGTLFHLTGIKKRKLVLICIGLTFLMVSASINYAALILIPVFFLWTCLAFKRHLEKPLFFLLFIYALFCLLNFHFAYYIVTHYGWAQLLTPFSPQHNTSLEQFSVSNLVSQYGLLMSQPFPLYTRFVMNTFIFLLGTLPFRNRTMLLQACYPLSFLITTLLFSAIKNIPVIGYYYYLVIPFVFVTIGIVIQPIPRNRIMILLSGAVILCTLWLTVVTIRLPFYRSNSFYAAEQTVNEVVSVVNTINTAQKSDNPHVVRITAFTKEGGEWESLAYGFFIEKKFGKVYQVYDHYNNLDWKASSDYFASVCQISDTTSQEWCNQQFTVKYPNYTFVKKITAPTNFPVMLYRKSS